MTTAASVGGWVELLLLRRSLNRRIGRTGLPFPLAARLWAAAFIAAAVGWGVKVTWIEAHPLFRAVMILVPFGCVYLGLTIVFGVEEARRAVARIGAKLRR